MRGKSTMFNPRKCNHQFDSMKKTVRFWVAFAGLLCVASCIKRENPVPPPATSNNAPLNSVNDNLLSLTLCSNKPASLPGGGHLNLNPTAETVMPSWLQSPFKFAPPAQSSYSGSMAWRRSFLRPVIRLVSPSYTRTVNRGIKGEYP